MPTYYYASRDGELVLAPDGQPKEFKSFAAAQKAAGIMGVAVIRDEPIEFVPEELPEEEIPDLTPYQRQYLEVVGRATNYVNRQKPELTGDKRDAHICMYALKDAAERRSNLGSMALEIVHTVATRSLHCQMGYASVGEFLKASGWDPTQGHANLLSRLGQRVIPALVSMGVDTQELTVPGPGGTGAKLLEATPALCRAIDSRDPDQIEAILDDVKNLNGKHAIRDKWRPNKTGTGRGVGLKVDDDTHVLVIVFNDPSQLSWAKSQVGGRVEWDIQGDGSLRGESLALSLRL